MGWTPLGVRVAGSMNPDLGSQHRHAAILPTVSGRRSGNVNTRHNQRSAPGSLLFRRSTVSVGWPECQPAFESLVKLTRALVRLLHNLSDGGGRRLRPPTLEGVRVDKASVIVTDLGKGW